jgi:hypothetical protein
MRTISFIFAFALLFLGPSVAGSSNTDGLPGIGTFAFSGSTAPSDASVLMAAVR